MRLGAHHPVQYFTASLDVVTMHITPTVVTRLAHAASNNQSDNVLPRITAQGPATAAAATPQSEYTASVRLPD